MRYMSEDMWDIWDSGQFVGDNRPVTRATVQKAVLRHYGIWRSLVFGQTEEQYEIPNIKTVSIDTRHQTDAATLTLTFLNQVTIDTTENLDLNYQGDSASPTKRELMDVGSPGFERPESVATRL